LRDLSSASFRFADPVALFFLFFPVTHGPRRCSLFSFAEDPAYEDSSGRAESLTLSVFWSIKRLSFPHFFVPLFPRSSRRLPFFPHSLFAGCIPRLGATPRCCDRFLQHLGGDGPRCRLSFFHLFFFFHFLVSFFPLAALKTCSGDQSTFPPVWFGPPFQRGLMNFFFYSLFFSRLPRAFSGQRASFPPRRAIGSVSLGGELF